MFESLADRHHGWVADALRRAGTLRCRRGQGERAATVQRAAMDAAANPVPIAVSV